MSQGTSGNLSVRVICFCSLCALQTHLANTLEEVLAGAADRFEAIAGSFTQLQEAVSSVVKYFELVAVLGLKDVSPAIQRKVRTLPSLEASGSQTRCSGKTEVTWPQ